MNKRNNRGFTLAELLIVVAIIAVLVAIAIPVFTAQLEKSREATDAANIRSAYAEIMVQAIDSPASSSLKKVVALRQTQTDWQNADLKKELKALFDVDGVSNTSSTLAGAGQGKSATISWVPSSGSSKTGHCALAIAAAASSGTP